MLRPCAVAVAVLLGASGSAHAGAFSLAPAGPSTATSATLPNAAGAPSSFSSRLFDTSRFHFSNMIVASSGFGSGAGSDGMRSMAYSTLSYDIGGPVSAAVTVGNRLFGAPRFPGDSGKMSLESLRLNYQPNKNFSLRVDMVGRNYLRDTAIWGQGSDWTRR